MRPYRVGACLLLLLTIALMFAAPHQSMAVQGDVLITPASLVSARGGALSLSAAIDTGSSALGAYQLRFEFDPDMLAVDTSVGREGITIGRDGFVSAINVMQQEGLLIVNGFNVTGKGPGAALALLSVSFRALNVQGNTTVRVIVETASDPSAVAIGEYPAAVTIPVRIY